jgi:hypothetical protein
MADDRLVKKVGDGIPEGKRKPRSTDEKMERRAGINSPSAYKKRRIIIILIIKFVYMYHLPTMTICFKIYTFVITYLLTYLLTPWSRALLENLIGSQLVKKFPASYVTRRFNTVFKITHHISLS